MSDSVACLLLYCDTLDEEFSDWVCSHPFLPVQEELDFRNAGMALDRSLGQLQLEP